MVHVASIGDMRMRAKISSENLKGTDNSEDLRQND